MLRKNFNIDIRRKQVAGGDARQEAVSRGTAERREQEASTGVWRTALVNRKEPSHTFL